jgi:hypothetical protein
MSNTNPKGATASRAVDKKIREDAVRQETASRGF